MADERTERWDSLDAQARALFAGPNGARLESVAREMIALDPERETGYRYAAEGRLRQGDAKGAVVLGREALARAPESDFVHYRLAVFLRRSGDLRGARVHIDAAIASDPSYASYWTEQGWIALVGGDDATADRCARRALEIRPEDGDALYLRATAAPEDTAEQARAALASYEAVLAGDPEFDPAWGHKARIHLRLGDLEKAEDAARTALSLDPEDADHRKTLYDVLKRRSWAYRVLRWPGDLVAKGFGLIDRIPWWLWILLCLVGIGSRVFLFLLAAGLLWLVFVYPLLKLYEWLSTSDVRRRAREIAPRRGAISVHRWPRVLRVALFLAAAGALWYGAWRFLGTASGRSTLAVTLGIAFAAAIVFGLVAIVTDAVKHSGRRRRRRQVDAMMETR